MALQSTPSPASLQIEGQSASATPVRNGVASTVEGPLRRVAVGDNQIAYYIRRSRRRKKTYQISIKDGKVLVAVPYRTTNRQAEEMVLQKAAWILSKLAVEEKQPEAPSLLSGETLPYLGKGLTLWVEGTSATTSGRPEVMLDGRRLKIAVPMGLEEEERRERVAAAVADWYGNQAAAEIWNHIERWWPTLGQGTAPTVRIRNQRRRWGSCSHDGVLRFNWRLAMLEPSLTEYVVVHELAHLTHMNHSPDFWGLVEQHLPDVKERRRGLREAGAALPQL